MNAQGILPDPISQRVYPLPYYISCLATLSENLFDINTSQMADTNPTILLSTTLVPSMPLHLVTLECLAEITTNLISGATTIFSKAINEGIPLEKFILETVKRSKVTLGVWSLGLFYLLKLQTKDPCFKESNCMDFARCGRRMFMASLMVASKFTQDKNYKNRTWANIMGVSVAEVNCVELTFLKLIEYQLLIPERIFNQWERFLQNQISLRKPKISLFDVRHFQKPDYCLRFSPYGIKPFSARCRKSLSKPGKTALGEPSHPMIQKESKFALPFLLRSPNETHFSPGIAVAIAKPYPPNTNSGYWTP